MTRKDNKILKNTSMLMIFNISKMLFPFITLPYLTRILSIDVYGTVAYVKTIMSYMQIIIDFGFVLSATKDVVLYKDNKEKIEKVIGDTLVAKMILGGLALFVLTLLIFSLPILRQNIRFTLLSYVVVFESIFLLDFLFRGLEVMHIITIRFIVMKIISTVLTFSCVKNDQDLLLIPIFDILGSFIAILLVFIELKKYGLKAKFSGIKNVLKSIRDSFVFFLSNVASTSFNAFSTIIIGIKLDASSVAFWSVCMQIVTAIQAFYTPISDGIYPEMVKTKKIGIIKKTIKICLPILILGCIGVYVCAKYGMLILGGEQYVIAVPILRLLIPTLFFGFFSIIFGWPTLGAIGKTKETTFSTICSGLFNIIVMLILIVFNNFTLYSIAIIRSLTEICLFTIRFYFFKKYNSYFANN